MRFIKTFLASIIFITVTSLTLLGFHFISEINFLGLGFLILISSLFFASYEYFFLKLIEWTEK